MKLSKRQRALAKREKRRPAREKRKARQRREYNKAVRKSRAGRLPMGIFPLAGLNTDLVRPSDVFVGGNNNL